MISFDCETTGADFHHGSLPFFVTTCDEEENVTYWEWAVDPLTRVPDVPREDLDAIRELIESVDGIALHNAKFDVTAMTRLYARHGEKLEWPWGKTRDTLLAAHLLHSNRPKNLTDMAFNWLNKNISGAETKLEHAVKESRALVRSKPFIEKHGEWAIAKEGRPDMPSAKTGGSGEKDRLWKNDYWLPAALASRLDYAEDHPHRSVLAEYSNVDSETTIALWKVLRREIGRRGLEKLYDSRLKLLPIAYRMETNGVTISKTRLDELRDRYRTESEEAGNVLINLAAGYGHELELPKGGTNDSLRTFMFDHLKLEKIQGKKSKTDAPTLDKAAMAHYVATLPLRSKSRTFVETLLEKRGRDTAIQYLTAYERFWLAQSEEFRVIHPSLNMTGTDTLRWSSSNPNEQNISKREVECRRCKGEGCSKCNWTGKSLKSLRYAFGPAPGREWWSLDAKNIELRLPAYESNETDMILLFEQPDSPPYYGSNHLLNFHTVYPDLWDAELKKVGIEKVGPHCKKKFASDYYQWCKNGGFAIQYNAGRATADAAFHRDGCFALLKSRFAKMENLNRRCISFSERTGYVETIPDKTVDPTRGYPLLVTRTDRGDVMPTVPLSFHIQGSAMWWMGKAQIRTQEQMDEWNKSEGPEAYRIALQVHDELVFDFPKRAHPKKNPARSNLGRIRVIQRLMAEGGNDFNIPTPVSVEYHPDNWSEGVTL